MTDTAGGAATNAGADFQQRVAAYFMAAAVVELDVSDLLHLNGPVSIAKVSFETGFAIDDLLLEDQSSRRHLIQANRSLNFSSSTSSDLYAVLKQFVSAYVADPLGPNTFMLVVSPRASRTLIANLVKFTESVRANDQAFNENPLNKAEREALQTLRTLVNAAFSEVRGRPGDDSEFNSLLARSYCVSLDFETGGSLEKSMLIVLAGKMQISPQLIWQSLISTALHYAANRMSVTRSALLERYGRFLVDSKETSAAIQTGQRELLDFHLMGSIQAGREIVLVKTVNGEFDYIVMELLRFNDDCKKRVKFYEGHCELLNGLKLEVVFRSSSWKGVERYIEETFDDTVRLGVMHANVEEDLDASSCAKAWSELCVNLLQKTARKHCCIHCDNPVAESSGYIVEIDEEALDHQVGQVHLDCRRATDRVVGIVESTFFKKYPILAGFDVAGWAASLVKGQALWHGIKGKSRGAPITLGWNSTHEYNNSARYCIRVRLADGSSRYVTRRGRVDRFEEGEANERAREFNEHIRSAREEKDPACYTSSGNDFGRYSTLVHMKAADEDCVECVEAEVVKYTAAVSQIAEEASNFYAPLLYLTSEDGREPLRIGNHVILLTDPLTLDKYLSNWERVGFHVESYKPAIIRSDIEFDMLVRRSFAAGLGVVIDPLIGLAGEAVGGIVVQDLEELIEEQQARKGEL